MNLLYKVKFKGEKDYQMHEMSFEIADADLPNAYRNLPLQDRFALGQLYVLKQGVLFRISGKDITQERGRELLDELKHGVIGQICDRIKNETDKGANTGSTEEVEIGA